MSNIPVFAEAEELRDLIRDATKQAGKDYVIVDVRGDDYKVPKLKLLFFIKAIY
jgi:hypothetical protein